MWACIRHADAWVCLQNPFRHKSRTHLMPNCCVLMRYSKVAQGISWKEKKDDEKPQQLFPSPGSTQESNVFCAVCICSYTRDRGGSQCTWPVLTYPNGVTKYSQEHWVKTIYSCSLHTGRSAENSLLFENGDIQNHPRCHL